MRLETYGFFILASMSFRFVFFVIYQDCFDTEAHGHAFTIYIYVLVDEPAGEREGRSEGMRNVNT